LVNLGDKPFEIVRGARIAQLVVAPVVRAVLVETGELDATARASDGFGSTGGTAGREAHR
jgi:dUTP pyrophosphatase